MSTKYTFFILTESSSPPRNHLNLGAGLAAAATHSTSTTVFPLFSLLILTSYVLGLKFSPILSWTADGGTEKISMLWDIWTFLDRKNTLYLYSKTLWLALLTGNSDVDLTCCWYSIATSVNGSYLAFPFSVILVYCLVDRDSTLPVSITMLWDSTALVTAMVDTYLYR